MPCLPVDSRPPASGSSPGLESQDRLSKLRSACVCSVGGRAGRAGGKGGKGPARHVRRVGVAAVAAAARRVREDACRPQASSTCEWAVWGAAFCGGGSLLAWWAGSSPPCADPRDNCFHGARHGQAELRRTRLSAPNCTPHTGFSRDSLVARHTPSITRLLCASSNFSICCLWRVPSVPSCFKVWRRETSCGSCSLPSLSHSLFGGNAYRAQGSARPPPWLTRGLGRDTDGLEPEPSADRV